MIRVALASALLLLGTGHDDTQVQTSRVEGKIRISRVQVQSNQPPAPAFTAAEPKGQSYTPPERLTWVETVDGEKRLCVANDGDGYYTTCTPVTDPDTAPDQDLVTEVRRAVETIGLPALALHIQPGDQVLINMDTIFYTKADTFTRTVNLLGDDIHIEATPTQFTWHHGDGTQQTTTTPGRTYPHKDVTHTYTQLHTDLKLRVDTTYTIRYQTPDKNWHTLTDTLTIPGPTSTLSTYEARPILIAPSQR